MKVIKQFPISILILGGWTLLGQSTAITGRVEDGQGRPLSGVSVRLLPRPPLTVTAGSPQTQSGPGGLFRLEGLAPGPYEVCAAAPAMGYLDTCAWSTVPPAERAVSITGGQQRAIPAIRMASGVRLKLNVLDVNGVLERDEPTPYQRLLVTLGVPGAGFTFLPLTARANGQRGYEMLVPRGRSVRVRLASNHFQVTDGQGRELDMAVGHNIDVPVPAQGEPEPLSFRVVTVQPRQPNGAMP